MLPSNIIYIAVIVSLIAYFFYFKNIFYGSTKPNLVSWFIWMLAPLLGFFFDIKAGAGLSALPVFLAGFGPLVVIIISILNKNAYWKLTAFDFICGIFALISLVLYIFTHNLEISIIFVILSDGLAAIPTIVKSWKFPETETAAVYLAGIFAQTLALLIIKNWVFSIYVLNVYFIVINIIIIFCIYRKKIFKTV
ncbi:MAG: hypothetical protein US41_C0018G0002 [Parcubacteria group bacterium GW2011_GWB1_37_13]|nr:MAG: hypothetical protein US41_C0018G0002 [Parcubacteria group bacterium GW2011_GWB1_37_13]